MRTLPIASALLYSALPLAVLSAQNGPSTATAHHSNANITSESVAVKSGNATLPGTIVTPTGNGKHPGILIISVGTDNSSALGKQLAQAFANKGIIALAYEASAATPEDAIAAIQQLKLRGDLNPRDVGVIGVGPAASVIAKVAKSQNLRYAIAVTSTQDPQTDPVTFGKLSQQVLVVHGMVNPFSEESDKYSQSVHAHARNVTLWPTPDSDIAALNASESALLGRVTTWATARSQ
jgi:hypothetical protein